MASQIALVTGANRGIGFEVCRQLARQGIHVILSSRDQARGQTAANALHAENLDVSFHLLDVTDPESVESIRASIEREFGRLDILVNNAGVYTDEGISIFDITFDLLKDTFAVNTFGPFLLCQAFVPMMVKHGYGRVVNVTSGYGNIHEMSGYTASYKMSKVALNALTRIVASEVRRQRNIKVNAVDPGWVRTDMGGRGAPRSIEQGADSIVWLATLPEDGSTDGYFYDRKRYDW